MKRKVHVLAYSLLGAAALAGALAGAFFAARADAAHRALEAGCRRHVLETEEKLQALSVQLAKVQVAMDTRTQVELLSAASRQADAAAAGLAALPLSHAAMGDTIRFCNQLSEYAMGLALLAASGDAPAAKELEMLEELRVSCTRLAGRMAVAELSAEPFSFDENVFYAGASGQERPLEEVADPERGMDYPALIYDGAFSDARRAGEPRGLNGTAVSQETAVEIARSYIGPERVLSAVPGAGTGGTLAAHGVILTLRDGLVLNAEVTQKGGQLLWIVPESASFTPALTLEECTRKAEAFLQSRGYAPMEASHYQLYNGLAVIRFVALQDGVLLYPDQLKLQLRMDTGEVVGMEANQYLMNHTRRGGLRPTLSSRDALDAVSSRLQAREARLCVIPEGADERLCYEVRGAWQDQTCLVYIDAHTGEEAEVLLMVDGADGPLAA